MHGADTGNERCSVPQPVLGIEHDGGEAFARNRWASAKAAMLSCRPGFV
jgi:hypothetical protein